MDSITVAILPTKITVPDVSLRHVRETHTRQLPADMLPSFDYTCGYMSTEIQVQDNEDLTDVVSSVRAGEVVESRLVAVINDGTHWLVCIVALAEQTDASHWSHEPIKVNLYM